MIHDDDCVLQAPMEFANWFEANAPDNLTLGALQLHHTIEQDANDARSVWLSQCVGFFG
jgi:hypothetical protein